MTDVNEKVVLAMSPRGFGDGVPLVILGVPTGAWQYMKDGRTHQFDLTRIGLRVRLVLYGAADHAAARAVIEDFIHGRGEALLDERRRDMSIESSRIEQLAGLCEAAAHALRSYQHGNASPELAEEVADQLEAALR